jgi:hypothetical protein
VVFAAGQPVRDVLISYSKLNLIEQADDQVRLFFFCVALSAHRIKDASPQLRLTVKRLLEPEVESWERTDSRAAALKGSNNLGQETR